MKLSLTLLIFFLTFLSISALSCLTSDGGKPIQFNLKVSKSDEIFETIRKQSTDDDEQNELCYIILLVNYQESTLDVILTSLLDTGDLDDENVQIVISVEGAAIDKITVEHALGYTCPSTGCELEFIQKYFGWFVNSSKMEVAHELVPFILGDEKNGKGE